MYIVLVTIEGTTITSRIPEKTSTVTSHSCKSIIIWVDLFQSSVPLLDKIFLCHNNDHNWENWLIVTYPTYQRKLIGKIFLLPSNMQKLHLYKPYILLVFSCDYRHGKTQFIVLAACVDFHRIFLDTFQKNLGPHPLIIHDKTNHNDCTGPPFEIWAPKVTYVYADDYYQFSLFIVSFMLFT